MRRAALLSALLILPACGEDPVPPEQPQGGTYTLDPDGGDPRADEIAEVVERLSDPAYVDELSSTSLGRASMRRMGGAAPAPSPSTGPITNFHAALESDAPAEFDQTIIMALQDRQLSEFASDDSQPQDSDDSLPPPTQGTLRARNRDGETIGEFPLRHTDVAAEVSGYLARTVVEQTYENDFDEPIEAVYVFPLPAMAAINGFVMEVGDRRILGIVRPRAEAERIYTQARAAGHTASLLTQERTNLFTQNVANIEPGGTVKIRITYFETLSYEAGFYEYVFPMVVAPRYIPGAPSTGSGSGGGGTSAPTDQVPDADRITPPVLRNGHDIALSVDLDAGLEISDMRSVAHRVVVEAVTGSRRTVMLAEADEIPNRDFILRWSVAADAMQFGVLAHRGERGGFLAMMIQPDLDPADEDVMARELTFILDVSGSMNGFPIAMSKEIVSRTLDELHPDDHFNIVVFAGHDAQLWDRPQPRTPENVTAAREFLRQFEGSGGTEMLAGLQRALGAEHDRSRLQMYAFLTDGMIGNEQQILDTITAQGGDARFFAFGPGPSVNRMLIDGIAERGRGAALYANPRNAGYAGRAVARFFDLIDSPVLVDVAIDWNGLPVRESYPRALPDLFAGQVIHLVAQYDGPATGTAYVTGRVGTREVRIPVEVALPESAPDHEALGPIWARHKIHELSRQDGTGEEITELAVEFQLVSAHTSFVAVDESRVVGDGAPIRIIQPVELPEGLNFETTTGQRPAGTPVRVPAWGVTIQLAADGCTYVVAVDEAGPVAEAGVRPGAKLRLVDRTMVIGPDHLEALLLQGTGGIAEVTFEPGGTVELPRP